MRIEELLGSSIRHEDVPCGVDPRFRNAGWATFAGAALTLGFLALVVTGAESTSPPEFPWGWISWVATFGNNPEIAFVILSGLLATTLVVAIATRGFTEANENEHHAMAAVVSANAVSSVPPAIAIVLTIIVTVVIVVAVVVLAVVFTIALVGFIAALGES